MPRKMPFTLALALLAPAAFAQEPRPILIDCPTYRLQMGPLPKGPLGAGQLESGLGASLAAIDESYAKYGMTLEQVYNSLPEGDRRFGPVFDVRTFCSDDYVDTRIQQAEREAAKQAREADERKSKARRDAALAAREGEIGAHWASVTGGITWVGGKGNAQDGTYGDREEGMPARFNAPTLSIDGNSLIQKDVLVIDSKFALKFYTGKPTESEAANKDANLKGAMSARLATLLSLGDPAKSCNLVIGPKAELEGDQTSSSGLHMRGVTAAGALAAGVLCKGETRVKLLADVEVLRHGAFSVPKGPSATGTGKDFVYPQSAGMRGVGETAYVRGANVNLQALLPASLLELEAGVTRYPMLLEKRLKLQALVSYRALPQTADFDFSGESTFTIGPEISARWMKPMGAEGAAAYGAPEEKVDLTMRVLGGWRW